MENIINRLTNEIKDKRIIVTGGTTGIGRATAELLISLGGRVFIFGRDTKDFEKAFEGIKEKYPDRELYGTTADVSKIDDLKRVYTMADICMGGVDILINNAAVPAEGIEEENDDDMRYIIDTNITGYLTFARAAVKRMSKQGSGHIINIGSMSNETRDGSGTIYVATKAAIEGFTEALRKEVNPLGIKVTLIEPGAVTSDMQSGSKEEHKEKIEKLEMLEAEDIAMSIWFCLCQPKRSDIVSLQIRPHKQII